MSKKEAVIDVDDSRYRITLFQQAAASCSGALITSIFGKLTQCLCSNNTYY